MTRPQPGTEVRVYLNPFDWFSAATLLLAACLHDRDAWERANRIVAPTDFPDMSHVGLYSAIGVAHRRGCVDHLELVLHPEPVATCLLPLLQSVKAVPPAVPRAIGMPTLIAALLWGDAAFVPRGSA
jgi:hypothetical protein